MATADEYANWIVNNADKKGTPEFDTVAQAYKEAKLQEKSDKEPAPQASDYAVAPAVNSVVNAVKPLVSGSATENARDLLNIAKNVTSWTPNSAMEVISHPVSTAKAYVSGHPWANTPIRTIAGNVGKNVLGAAAQGVMAPENILSAPYSMAAYEQAKIRANPTAPEYATTPYAQQYRGEYATQGQAGAANRRAAIGGQQYGAISPEEHAILEQDKLDRAIRMKAAQKALQPIAPGQ